MKVNWSPRKVVSAMLSSTLMPWSRASGVASPTVFLSTTVPWRVTVPVRASMASSSVVLPER